MRVVDTEKSEHGPQRRRDSNGRLLHCCCICGKLETWNEGWSGYASVKEMDDGTPYPKFCSDKCRARGGPKAAAVTAAMRLSAKNAEWRPAELVWREATSREKYDAAAYAQRKD